MKRQLIENDTQNQTLDSIYEELISQFEYIIIRCQAFDHCTYIINDYYKFKSKLFEQLKFQDTSTQLWDKLKELDNYSDQSQDIINMLNEYEEYRHPAQIQEIKSNFIKQQPKVKQKAKTLKLCESWMIEGELSASNQQALQTNIQQLDQIQEEDDLIADQSQQLKQNSQNIIFQEIILQKTESKNEIDEFEQQIQLAINLYQDAQLDISFQLIKSIFIKLNSKQMDWFIQKGYQDFYEDLEQKKRILDMNIQELESGGWKIEKQTENLTIKYKLLPQSSTVTVYLDSIFEANITKLMALINEIDLYHNYVPFCQKSKMNKQLSKACKICDIVVYFPFLSDRRAVFVGEGIDRLQINGTIVFLCRSIDQDQEYQQRHNIVIEQNKKLVSLIINYYIFELTPLENNKCRVRAITNSNPQVKYLPNWLIGYLARKMAYELFERMEKITKNFEKSLWFQKYNENNDFYQWIDDKVKKYFELRQK